MVPSVTNLDVRKKAFFSGTDDNDDRASCAISGVVGKLSTNPELVFRFNLPGGGGKESKIEMKMGDIFVEETQPVEVPKEWLGQVQKDIPVYLTQGYRHPGYSSGQYDDLYGGGRGGNANNFRGGRNHVQTSRPAGASSSVSDLAGLASDELLERLGFPFVEGSDEEGQSVPFVGASQKRGRTSKKAQKKSSRKTLRLPSRPQ